MRTRLLVTCAIAALASAAAAQAQPSRFQLRATVAPGASAGLTIGAVPQGEFAFSVRASSDGTKDFTLTQQRNGGRRFTILGPVIGRGACQGAAGTLVCTGITTPATPGGRRWTFLLRNRSERPIAFTLLIAWRRVASAG